MSFSKRQLMLTGILYLLTLACAAPLFAAPTPNANAIATASPLATQAGHDILAAGGNAFDAAIAITAVLAVVEPYSSGIGGGGFYLLQEADSDSAVMLDARERAPLAATRDMYLDPLGEPVSGLSVDGVLAAGIPGIPKALATLASQYGGLPLSRSMRPAMDLAREGFPVTQHYRRMAGFRLSALRASAASGVFLHHGEVPALGHIIRQPDLANTLGVIATGENGFYQGKLATTLVEGVRAARGIWSLRDLAQYQVIKRVPVQGRYRDMTITAAAPPSSGGVVLVSMLNVLEQEDFTSLSVIDQVHWQIEAMRRAYRDRAEYLGDPDFISMPIDKLVSKGYARELHAQINPQQATPSSSLPVVTNEQEVRRSTGTDTTHFSVLDHQGNRVSATLSINYPFGSGFTVPGTGVLLNDEMDDFSIKPGTPNVYGLIGAEANAIVPGKRMLSSMTPTFVETDNGLLLLGTPGGSRIITMVLQAILGYESGVEADEIAGLPRLHHQYLPDRVQYERGTLDAALVDKLSARGHQMSEEQSVWGNMQLVHWNKKTGHLSVGTDPRGEGAARVKKVVDSSD
jgi:gamma-glutamyltranspeptidase/glutathione hydrolase